MMTNAPKPSLYPIDVATRHHERIFLAYIMVLLLTAAIVAFFTWWVWDSGNKIQEAVQADADARIEKAKNDAAQANTKTKELDGDLTTAKGKVATLEKEAADARTEQHNVEIELAKQQERTANAERAFLELKAQTAPRRVSSEQRKKFLDILKVPQGVKISITVSVANDVPDGEDFKSDLLSLFRDAGIHAEIGFVMAVYIKVPRDVVLEAGSNHIRDAEALAAALTFAGIAKPPVTVWESKDANAFGLIIGIKTQENSN